MTCTAHDRVRAHELSDALAASEHVLGVIVQSPDVGVRSEWTIEATLAQATAPPAVLRVVERYGGSLVGAMTRGQPERLELLLRI